MISSDIAIFSDVSRQCNILLSQYIAIKNAHPWFQALQWFELWYFVDGCTHLTFVCILNSLVHCIVIFRSPPHLCSLVTLGSGDKRSQAGDVRERVSGVLNGLQWDWDRFCLQCHCTHLIKRYTIYHIHMIYSAAWLCTKNVPLGMID